MEKENIVKILMAEFVTHDVKRFIVEKPKGFKFIPGQATELSINLPEWKNKKNPFTFTSLNDDLVLEFTIKGYPERKGVTAKLHELKPGDELIIRKPWGTINYKGPGTFIAGGAGLTPFIAILRDLKKKGKIEGNKLIFSNKTADDIIIEKELKSILENDVYFTLTREKNRNYDNLRIDEKYVTSSLP